MRAIFLTFFVMTTQFLQGACWIQSDYLFWTTKKAPLSVPLLTQGSMEDPLPGALGQSQTKVLLGNEEIAVGWQSGFRVNVGAWTDASEEVALEVSFLMLPEILRKKKSLHTSGEPGSLNIALPIHDVTGLWGLNGFPGETVFMLTGPLSGDPGFQGDFQLKVSSQLQGLECNGFRQVIDSYPLRLDAIGGIRWLALEESLGFTGKTASASGSSLNSFYNFKDHFKTDNNFFGGQLGLKLAYLLENWSFEGLAKAAFGLTNQRIKIKGTSQTSDGNLFYLTKNTGGKDLKGGIFAQPTNQGIHTSYALAKLFEAGGKVGYYLTECFEISLGYNFLWMDSLLRPGDQIDRRINPTRTALAEASRETAGVGPDTPIPFGTPAQASLAKGSKRPKFKPEATNFWAQGLTLGINLTF